MSVRRGGLLLETKYMHRVETDVTLRDWLRMYHLEVLREWSEAWVVWVSLKGYVRAHHLGLLQDFEAWQQGAA